MNISVETEIKALAKQLQVSLQMYLSTQVARNSF